jgi:hypothetical protein
MWGEVFAEIACAIGIALGSPLAPAHTEAVCIPQDEVQQFWQQNYLADDPGAAGWFDGNTDTIYIVTGWSIQYSYEIFAHEAAHAHDWARGTEVNGYPSWWSQTHTGFDVEEWARLVTYVNGDWPADEQFPDPIPSAEDVATMRAAGWF